MPTSARVSTIARIAALPGQVEALVSGLTAEQLVAHPLAGEWSVAQNVHHLFDSHVNSYVRCKLIATQNNPTLVPYNQDLWAELPDASESDIAVSLMLLRNLHARWVRFWESLPEQAWDRVGTHLEYGQVTLASQLESYAAHGEAHLDQIRRTLAAQGVVR